MHVSMQTDTALARLCRYSGRFPLDALREVVASRERSTPQLLSILEQAVNDPREIVGDPNYIGHFVALYLLAQFRETRALPLVIELFSLPENLLLAITDDVTTDGLDRILASVGHKGLVSIKALIENPDADEYVRAAALSSLVCMIESGDLTRNQVIDYFREIYEDDLVERVPSFIWSQLACLCADIHPGDLVDDVRLTYDQGLVDESVMEFEELERVARRPVDAVLADLHASRYGIVTDAVEEMSRWDMWRETQPLTDVLLRGRAGRGLAD